jgi:glycine/D-amino acid oxidase-like deaminating enzyme
MAEGSTKQSDWEEEIGLSEETAYVVIYPNQEHAEQWMEEAEENGYGSRSKYLYELIQEARTAREGDFLSYGQDQGKVEELEAEVERLQEELEEARSGSSAEIDIEHDEFVTSFLGDTYQPLEDLLHEITESGVLTGIVKDSVEDQLFELAERDLVEYKEGYGWRLKDDGGEVSA